jgi:outer membrane protein, multidrug efflux system
MNNKLPLLTIPLLLAGCSMAPEYHRPDLPVPAAFPALAPDAAVAASVVSWKDFFHDPALRQLIALSLDNNRDLRQAIANVEAYRAQYRIQRADLLPSLEAGATGSLQRIPADVAPTGQAGVYRQYGVQAGLTSYELDLFGRVRNLGKVALEHYLATQEARKGTQLSLIASVADAYFTWRIDRRRYDLALQTRQSYDASLNLVSEGVRSGVSTALDQRQAETALAGGSAQVERLRRIVAIDENALQLLLGTPIPKGLDGTFPLDAHALADLPAGLPADLLIHRPDIQEAEHNLIAATANIGVARAAFFPKITLTAAGGTESADMQNLFSGGQGAWSFAPQISLPIFSGGRLKAGLGYARAQQSLLLSAYEKAIQVAFREVADGLAAHATYGAQLGHQRDQVETTASYLALAQKSYHAGVETYLVVLDAQRSLYTTQDQYLQDQLAQLSSQVALYKALGGGIETAPRIDAQ